MVTSHRPRGLARPPGVAIVTTHPQSPGWVRRLGRKVSALALRKRVKGNVWRLEREVFAPELRKRQKSKVSSLYQTMVRMRRE